MVIYAGLIWVATAVLLLLFAQITQDARKRLQQMKDGVPENVKANNTPQTVHPQDPPEEPGSASVLRKPRPRWIIGVSVLAFLLAPVFPVVLFLNSYVLSISLSAFIPQGIPLFTVTVGAWVRDIFITDILAFLVAVLQGVGGAVWFRCVSALHDEGIDSGSRAVIQRVSAFAIMLTVIALVMEFAATVYRGCLLMDIYNGMGSGLQALVTGFGDVVLGALVIDFLLVPIFVGIASVFQRIFTRGPAGRVPDVTVSPRYPTHLRILAFLDRTIMDWLRAVDRWASGRVRG